MLPVILPVPEIHERLKTIFPEGTPHRENCTREVAAKTIFVMLYVGAVEGSDTWLRPNQVSRMTDSQAANSADAARTAWAKRSLKGGREEIPGRWYAVDTRESVRDDAIRAGLIANGVVIERPGIATTSSKPRYALKGSFVALFDPKLDGEKLKGAIADWQVDNLSAGALARITIRRKGAIASADHVLVTFPSGETRRMQPGESSIISKAVIEEFAKQFLEEPGVIFLSESKDKVVERDNKLAKSIGLHIEADKHLPDIILADVGPKSHPLLVFVEVVSTDGPVTQQRKAALLKLTEAAGFSAKHVVFVTAYHDRSVPAFKKTVNNLAWGTFAWFASEPENLLRLYEGKTEKVKKLSELLR